MRIGLISDIHGDFIPARRRALVLGSIADTLRGSEVDVVVVAGDVANHYSKVASILGHLAVGRAVNLYVPGNHDIWRTDREVQQGRTSFGALTLVAPEVCGVGFHYLPGAGLTVGGWGFAGSLGWYDGSFADPGLVAVPGSYERMEYDGFVWQDRDRARWTDASGRRLTDGEVTAQFVGRLEADLRSLGCDEAGSGPPTVAVTHVLPVAELTQVKGVPGWDYFNAFIGSSRFGEMYARFPAVRAGFAGHTHASQRTIVGGRLFATSPIGYYGTAEFPRDLEPRVAIFETSGRDLVEITPGR